MIHFLFTTVALHVLNAINLTPYFERISTHDISSSLYHVVMFHNKQDRINDNFLSPPDIDQSFIQVDGIDMACHSNRGTTGEASRLLQEYIRHRQVSQFPTTWVANHSQISCTLYDSEHQLLFLFGDTVGALPLWYELQDAINTLGPQIFVSSHLLAASSLGFKHLTPVGPGLTVSIDMSSSSTATTTTTTTGTGSRTSPDTGPMSSFEVISSQHWSEGRSKQYAPLRMAEAEHRTIELLESTSRSLSSILNQTMEASASTSWINPRNGILTELDMHDDSSVLLECALHATTHPVQVPPSAQSSSRLRFDTAPLISDPAVLPAVLSADLQAHIRAFHEGFKRDTLAWEPGATRIAVSRAVLCQEAQTTKRTILAYETGLPGTSERALAVYFQNFFCSLLDVPIIYPFATMKHIAQLHVMSWKQSFLRMATDSYLTDGLCGATVSAARINTAYVLPSPSSSSAFSGWRSISLEHTHTQTRLQKEQREPNTILVFKGKKPAFLPSSPEKNFKHRVRIEAELHAHGPEREIFLLLVTSSYIEIFMNFVCHIKAVADMPSTSMFLVLTPHQDIAEVAKGAGFGYLLLDFEDPSLSTIFSFDNMPDWQKQTGADFGTIAYQRMIYVRTFTALVLLHADFNPVIVDIDTVWLRYPLGLLLINKEGEDVTGNDVLVTFDQDEICGCFIYLNSTKQTITFWTAVVDKHLALLEDNYENNRNYSGHMSNFFDSEQKILTDFLLHGQYHPSGDDHNLKVYTHPRLYFLNGIDYFLSDFELLNQKFVDLGLPAVIHNNFIIGNGMKKNRFQRFGLWRVDTWDLFTSKEFRSVINSDNNHNYDNWVLKYVKKFPLLSSRLYCSPSSSTTSAESTSMSLYVPFLGTVVAVAGQVEPVDDPLLKRWTEHGMFQKVSHNSALRALSIILPLHNEMEHSNKYWKAMVMAEGVGAVKGKIFINRNPPSYFEFDNAFFVAELSYDFAFTTFTVEFESAGLISFVDVVGGNNEAKSVSIDRSYKYQQEADERVRNSSQWVGKWDSEQNAAAKKWRHLREDVAIDDPPVSSPPSATERDTNTATTSDPDLHTAAPQFSFQLRVLTYNRPASLQRLLKSLEVADYGEDNDVSLCILIDFPSEQASVEDLRNRDNVILIAQQFQWQHGNMSVVIHSQHHGLKLQWLDAFQPPSRPGAASVLDETVFGIVLEDDLEVSPFFFLWTLNAVIKYYTPKQILLHQELLSAIRLHIAQDPQELMHCLLKPLEDKNSTQCGALDQFVERFGGLPLQYGICLAKQREDFFHYPHELEIRNGHTPFLYSPIGTWGTVLYPIIWEAFREWWLWREKFRVDESDSTFPPFVDFDLLTNHYYMENPTIWSPWHIRFAYETGAKCLYPNLPGLYSLVSNHREKGVNYRTTLGSRTITLQPQHVHATTGQILSTSALSDAISIPDYHSHSHLRCESPAFLWSFPSYSRLIHQQYDLSIRRAGRNLYSVDGLHVTAEPAPSSRPQSAPSMLFSQSKAASQWCVQEVNAAVQLSERHWHMISDMLEGQFLGAQHVVLHIEPAPDVQYFAHLGLDATSASQQGKVVSNIVLSTNCAAWQKRELWRDIAECLMLPDQQDTQSWQLLLSKLQPFSFQLVIVNEKIGLLCLKEKLSSIWKDILYMHDFAFLLMLGSCAGAPTSVTLPSHQQQDPSSSFSLTFTVLEDICSERMWMDTGAVLYQRDSSYRRYLTHHGSSPSAAGSANAASPVKPLDKADVLSSIASEGDVVSNDDDLYVILKRHQGHIVSRRFRQRFAFLNK